MPESGSSHGQKQQNNQSQKGVPADHRHQQTAETQGGWRKLTSLDAVEAVIREELEEVDDNTNQLQQLLGGKHCFFAILRIVLGMSICSGHGSLGNVSLV